MYFLSIKGSSYIYLLALLIYLFQYTVRGPHLKKNPDKLHIKLRFNVVNGNRALADLIYGEEGSISPSTLVVAATKG